MARPRILHWGLALTIFVLVKPNIGFKEDACTTTCRGSQHLPPFQYVEGTTYKYSFESAIQISLSSSKSQYSNTGIKGIALVTPLSHCSHLLRLQNVEVVSGNSQKYTNIAGIDKPIQFNINDGVLNDHICVEPDDMHNSLNIKRAVASLFQVDTRYEHQTDVFGFCPTVSTTTIEHGDVLIEKTKDLDQCDFRETIREDFMVSSFNPYSDIKTTPVLSGEYLSQQKIKNGILDKAFVFENYTYLAFTDIEEDKDNLGAQAKVVTRFEYIGTSREYAQSRVNEPKSIIFDNPHPITSDRSNIDSILSAVRKLTDGDDLAINEHTARDFLDLVKILRDSNKDDILTAFRQVKAGAGLRDRVKAREVFLDALFKCGTGNAIVVGVELLKNRELGPIEESLVYLSFAFVKHATLSALEAASSLLDTYRLPRAAYLGIGNLAGRYCREHQCDTPAVSQLTQKLTGKLGYGKAHTRDEENEIIYALKALANIHHLNEHTLIKVTNIVKDKQSPTRLRVAALDTYLSDACHESVRNGALDVLKDIQEDSELRIKSYLVFSNCPDRHSAQEIKNLLDKEPSYQVGGFIVSHLRYLSTSASPDKKRAAHFLGKINTNKKFPIDPRKYSFNGEFSYDLGVWGTSSSAEANVIYSQNSFLPRSTSLNLTAEVFGHTINFLEIGTRQQNLDRLLEHYFGPLGVFNSVTPDELKKSGENAFNKISDYFLKRFETSRSRGKRDVSKIAIDNFGKEVQIRTNELNSELDLDFSIKLFGSELFFLSISDNTEDLSPEDVIDRFFDSYESNLAPYKRFDKNFHTNSLFLDSEFSYPTSLGFPLRLALEGTAFVQVKTKGDIDVNALLDENPNKGFFKLSVIPSANIEVAASITLDSQVFESGLKVVSILHTATGGDLEVDLKDGNKGIEVKFSIPLQKQKVISATHEVVLNSRELGKPEKIQPIQFGPNENINLCLNELSTSLTGLNYCVDISSPKSDAKENPVLAGNYKFSVEIDNEDFSHFHYKEEYFNDYRKSGAQITAEVIGAKQNKKTSFTIEAFSLPDLYVKASLTSPITVVSAEGRIISNEHEYSVSYEAKQDINRYYGKLGVTASGSPTRRRFTPILEYIVPGTDGQQDSPVKLLGAFVIEDNGPKDIKATFEDLRLSIKYPGQRRGSTYSINGNLGRANHDTYVDITLSDGYLKLQEVGKLHIEKNLIKLDEQFKNNLNPDANVHIIYEFRRSSSEIDSFLDLIYGPDPDSKYYRLTAADSLIYKHINDHDYEIRTKNKLTYPAGNLAITADYTATPNSVFYDAEIQYEKFIIGSEMNLKYNQRVDGDYDLDFQLYDEDDEIELKAKRNIQGGVNTIENILVVNGEKYEVGGNVTIHEGTHFDLTADLLVKIPQLKEDLIVYENYKASPGDFNNVFKVTGNYKRYVDSTFTAKDDNVNGNLRIKIRNSFTLDAFVKESKGVGSGELTVDVKGQLFKAETTYTTVNPYNIRLSVYPDYNRNRRDYLILTSNNDVQKHSLNSRNTIDLCGSKTLLNGAYSLNDENKSASLDIDFTLPDSNFGAIKYNYKQDESSEGIGIDQSLVFEARGFFDWRNAKLSIRETIKDVNLNENKFDYSYLIFAEDGAGKSGHIDFFAKHSSSEVEPITEEYKLRIYKHYENDGLEAKASAVHKDYDGSYNILLAAASNSYLFDLNGNYDLNSLFSNNNKSPITEKITIEVRTPSTDVQHLKFDADVSVGEMEFPRGYLDVKGTVGFVLNENQRSRSGNSVNVKADGELKLGIKDATARFTTHSQSAEPITITAKYNKYDESTKGKGEKYTSSVAVNYERHKNIKTDVTIFLPNENEVHIDFNLESPQSPPTKIRIDAKESSPKDHYLVKADIITNNNRYELIEELDFRKSSPGFKLQLTYPNRQIDKIILKTNIPNDKTIQGEIQVQFHESNFALDGKLDATLVSEEEFSIKLTANCPSLKIHNFIADIQNKPLGHSASSFFDKSRSKRKADQTYGYIGPQSGGSRHRDRYRQEQPSPVNYDTSGHGEHLRVSIQHSGKNILSGSASYLIRTEGDKFTVEGAGTFKYESEPPRQHNYKIVQQKIYGGRESGEGVEYTWNLNADKDVIEGTLKITNRELAFVTNVCETNSQCLLRVQASSKVFYISPNNFEIDEKAIFDFGYWEWNEIGFKNKISNRENVFDASGEVYADSASRKYRYKLYSSDKNFEASLTTPQRVISFEGKIQAPLQNGVGPTSFSIDLYLDKNNQPNQKTSLIGLVHCQNQFQMERCNAELKFSNPSLQRDLGITYVQHVSGSQVEYSLVLDIFTDPNNKIILKGRGSAIRISREGGSGFITVDIKSQGLNVDLEYQQAVYYGDIRNQDFGCKSFVKYNVGRIKYELITLVIEASSQKALLDLDIFNRKILKVDAKINNRENNITTIDANVHALGVRPATVNLDATTTSLKCTVAELDNPSELFEITLDALTSNGFGFDVIYYERGLPLHLLTSYIKITDKDELESSYHFDKEHIRRLITDPAKKEYNNFKHELQDLGQNAKKKIFEQARQVNELIKWNLPDLKPIERYYRSELEKFNRELKYDPTIRKITNFVTNYLQPILEWISKVTAHIDEINRRTEETIKIQYVKLLQAYEHELLPWLKEYFKNASDAVVDVWTSVENILYNIVDKTVQYLDRHEKEIKQFCNFVTDNLEDVIVFSIKFTHQLEKELTEELSKLYDQIKGTGILHELKFRLKQALKGIPVPESYLQLFRESVATLQESIKNPSIKEFVKILTKYIEQKLEGEPVDDAAAIQSIIWAGYNVLSNVEDEFEISWKALYAIPKLIEAEISPLTYLLYGDWPDLEDLLNSISLDFDDWSIPEEFDAVIANGQYIFTFDGKQLILPGSCNYLLAHDAVNRNFSIVGSYSNGQLMSITFADIYDTITLRKGGHLLINQAPAEYPIHKQHRLEVYRNYESITISSKAGVKIVCGPELLVCGFYISGYYHAQLRGLLGNGNNEPYDDFTLPSGLIVTNDGTFENSYKLERHCADVQSVSPHVPHHPTCTRLFGENSPLSFCRYFVRPRNYRKACDHAIATGIKNADRAIAIAYARICGRDFYTEVPNNYVTCDNYEKPTKIDEGFKVVTPGQVADIVLLVDQDTVNAPIFRDLIHPLTTQLTSALGAEGIRDVDFHLIGYGGEYEKHPVHYTVDGKLSFKAGQIPNVQFSTPLKESNRETIIEYIERVSNEIELLTGQDMLVEAYTEAKNIPFRAHAVKSIIVLNSKQCDKAQIEPLHDLLSLLLHDKQISVHLFTPIKGLNLKDHTTSNIVGFDENNIFTYSTPEGSKQHTSFETDNICIDFALNNRGNVFVTNNFIQARSKSQYVQISARNIAKKLTNVEQWLDCKCTRVNSYNAQNKCTVSYSRKRETASQGRRSHGYHSHGHRN